MRARRSPQGAPADIADATITIAESVPYTGTPRTPSVTVVYDGATLVVNQDYFVSYNDNTEIGAATVVITGTGEFTGQVVKTFQIASSGSGGGTWGPVDLSSATLVGTYSQYSLALAENGFCVRGGYVFSTKSDGTVYRYPFNSGTREIGTGSTVCTKSNGHAGGWCISRDGLHSYMYIKYSREQALYMYDHATAWDISDTDTHYWDHGHGMPYTIPLSNYNSEVVAADINQNGTMLFTIDHGGKLGTHRLSTAFDCQTAQESLATYVNLSELGLTDKTIYGMQIAPDGLAIVIIDAAGMVIMCNLATAWDMSTIDVSTKRTFQTLPQNGIYGVGLTDDASTLFVKASYNGYSLYLYALS